MVRGSPDTRSMNVMRPSGCDCATNPLPTSGISATASGSLASRMSSGRLLGKLAK
jgi:hypothetical protein